MLKCVEGDHAHRFFELTRHEIVDDGFEIGPLNFGLAVDWASCAKTIDNEVDSLIGAIGHDGRRPASSWHTHLQAQRNPDSSVISGVGSHYGRNFTYTTKVGIRA